MIFKCELYTYLVVSLLKNKTKVSDLSQNMVLKNIYNKTTIMKNSKFANCYQY